MYFVVLRPFSKDGFFSDEAVSSMLCVLVEFVHPALVDLVLLVVMVGDNTVIGSTVRRRKETDSHWV